MSARGFGNRGWAGWLVVVGVFAAASDPARATETWANHSHAVRPAARTQAAFAYHDGDTVTGAVLFGGRSSTGAALDDLWIYDALHPTPGIHEWRQLSADVHADGGPSARWDASMAFDPVRKVMVLFGGTAGGGSWDPRTWEWDGVTWTLRRDETTPPPTPPPPVHSPPRPQDGRFTRLEWDPNLQAIVRTFLIGCSFKECSDCNAFRFDRWDPVDGVWLAESIGLVALPFPSRYDMDYDASAGRHVLLGAKRDNICLPSCVSGFPAPCPYPSCSGGDCWSDERIEMEPGVPLLRGPDAVGPRADHAMVYDADRGHLILFGGSTGPTDGDVVGTTHERIGGTFQLLSPAQSPDARRQHAMAYDPHTKRVILFGGTTGTGFANRDDTWEFPETVPTGTGTASDNITILLRRETIEGGLHLGTLDTFSGPEFWSTGDGFCRDCYFDADIGGFETLRTRKDDAVPSFRVREHVFTADAAFAAAPNLQGCSSGQGYTIRLTYWFVPPAGNAELTLRLGPLVLSIPAPSPVPTDPSWVTAEVCAPVAPGALADPIYVGTSGAGDVYFRELTVHRIHPSLASPELPDVDVLPYSVLSPATTCASVLPPFCATTPAGFVGPLCRYDHGNPSACVPLPNMGGKSRLRVVNAFEGCCPGSTKSCSGVTPCGTYQCSPSVPGCCNSGFFGRCNGDDMVALAPGGPNVALLGKQCAGFEDAWVLRPCLQGEGTLTLEYEDTATPQQLIISRDTNRTLCIPAPPRRVIVTPGTSGGTRTDAVLSSTVPECDSSTTPVDLWLQRPAGDSAYIAVRQVTWSRTRVEVEMPSGAGAGLPFSGWVRVRRPDGTLATGVKTFGPGRWADISIDLRTEEAEPSPATFSMSPTGCPLDGGRCRVTAAVAGTAIVHVDAILRYFAGVAPFNLATTIKVRSVPVDLTVVTSRPSLADIASRDVVDSMYVVNGEVAPHTGWNVEFNFAHEILESDLRPGVPLYRRLPMVPMEATPGGRDETGAPVAANLLNRVLQPELGGPPLREPGPGVAIRNAPTDRVGVRDMWMTARGLHGHRIRGQSMVYDDVQNKAPGWFQDRFGCWERDGLGKPVIDPNTGLRVPVPCVATGDKNMYTQVRSANAATVNITNPGVCYNDPTLCHFNADGRLGTTRGCWNDPNFRELTLTGMERMLMMVGCDDAVQKVQLVMQFLNEPTLGNHTPDACYCEDCLREWWRFLAARYPSRAAMNLELGVTGDFFEVVPPPLDGNGVCDDGSGNGNLCRDWLLFRTDTLTRWFNDVAKVWHAHLANRAPSTDRFPTLQTPITSSTMTFDRLAGEGWVWPRHWESLGSSVGGFDAITGNNGDPLDQPSLMTRMRDTWAAGKPYLPLEVWNAYGDGCENVPVKTQRVTQAGADYLLGGEANLLWLSNGDPLPAPVASTIQGFLDNPRWREMNRISRWFGRLGEANQSKNGIADGLEPRVAVLVSDGSVARGQLKSRDFATCDPANPIQRAGFLSVSLVALHNALYNVAGYDYRFITERDVLDRCPGPGCPLNGMQAVFMAGFQGDDLTGSCVQSDCRGGGCGDPPQVDPLACPERGGARCLTRTLLADWQDDAPGRALVAVLDRPLERGEIGGTPDLSGPWWGLGEAVGACYHAPTSNPPNPLWVNFVEEVRGGPDLGAMGPACLPGDVGPCWSDLAEFGCGPGDGRKAACVTLTAPDAHVILEPCRAQQACGIPAGCDPSSLPCPAGTVPAAALHRARDGGDVYALIDGMEIDAKVPFQGSCVVLQKAAYHGRLFSLILRRAGIVPIADTHRPRGPECLVDLHKNFGIGACSDGDPDPSGETRHCALADLVLYNPFNPFRDASCGPTDQDDARCVDPRCKVVDGCPDVDMTGSAAPRIEVNHLLVDHDYDVTVDDGSGPLVHLPVQHTDPVGRLVIDGKLPAVSNKVDMPHGRLIVLHFQPL